MSGGVSIDTGGPAEADLYMRAAVEGGSNFMKRLEAFADAKAAHDEALAELNLGRAAKAALDDSQAKQAEAAAKLAEANATLEAAKQSAASTVADANKTAAETLAKAKADAGSIIAAAERLRGEAQQAKSSADAALTAANSERAQLRVEREAASRMAEEAETARATFQGKTDRLHAVLAELSATTPAAAAAVQLAS
jgi:F0F1-type ATP synthase membrane subunit b/b'